MCAHGSIPAHTDLPTHTYPFTHLCACCFPGTRKIHRENLSQPLLQHPGGSRHPLGPNTLAAALLTHSDTPNFPHRCSQHTLHPQTQCPAPWHGKSLPFPHLPQLSACQKCLSRVFWLPWAAGGAVWGRCQTFSAGKLLLWSRSEAQSHSRALRVHHRCTGVCVGVCVTVFVHAACGDVTGQLHV